MLKKIISGGQTGADIAGLQAAKDCGYETGGWMPFGYLTLDGCKPEYKALYGVKAHSSSSYVPRTKANVKDSDGTIRLAFNFSSPGEICTLKAIESYKKPHFDCDLSKPSSIDEITTWIKDNNIETLNVAGNAEQTASGTYEAAYSIISSVLKILKNSQNIDGSSSNTSV